MIGSPSDIRSAIRVYYGGNASGDVEQTPAAPSSAVHDGKAPAPASSDARREPPPLPSKRNRAATDTGASALAAAPAPAGPPLAAGASQAAATAQPSRLSPLPPHAGVTHSAGAMAPAAAPVPTPPPSRPAASPASSPTDATDTPRASLDSPDSSPEIEAREIVVPGKRGARMVALTLLDGTSLTLPTRPRRRSEPPPPPGISEQLTSRDLIAALRALSHGADVAEILGDNVHWEAMFAALLSILLKKGIIADWEFIDELRKI
jgi:hypothetical protein